MQRSTCHHQGIKSRVCRSHIFLCHSASCKTSRTYSDRMKCSEFSILLLYPYTVSENFHEWRFCLSLTAPSQYFSLHVVKSPMISFAPSLLFHQTLPKSRECTNLSINSQSQVLDSLLALYHKTSGILKIRKRFFQVPWDFNQYDHTWCRIFCSVVFSIGAVALKSLHPLLELFAVGIQKKRCWLIF